MEDCEKKLFYFKIIFKLLLKTIITMENPRFVAGRHQECILTAAKFLNKTITYFWVDASTSDVLAINRIDSGSRQAIVVGVKKCKVRKT